MNKVYKLKKCNRTGALVPVAEFSRTPSLGRRTLIGMTALLGSLGLNGIAFASGLEVNSGNTKVYNAPNDVPVIDIATTNGSGVSHNRFNHYNVGQRGVVLNNNAPHTQAGALQSQLAGQVVPNTNLSTEARIILNEVVQANHSSLNGYTEVVGRTADVVVANPWGITCSGCGFINTDRVTLTTGTPTIGANGSLEGFQVNQGGILITGSGLDARNQNVLDLVARTVTLDGQVNGQDIQISSGNNDYAYSSRTTNARSSTGSAPSYAIDSTALGGMYANRIRLIATEVGVGVRMMGEAAATADDFILTASGKIEIHNRISAERDLKMTYSGSSDRSDSLSFSGVSAELAARQDIMLTAQNGAGIILNEGKITAEGNLIVNSGTLDDTASGNQSRFAANNLTVTTSDGSTLNGATWGAGNRLSMTVASLSVGQNGVTLYSGSDVDANDGSLNISTTNGNLDLSDTTLSSADRLTLSSSHGIGIDAGTSIQSGGDAVLTAETVHHAGAILGGDEVTISATSSGNSLTNTGRLQSGGRMSLIVANGTLTNSASGIVLSNSGIDIDSASLDNQGRIVATEGMLLTTGGLTNGSSTNSDALILGSTGSGASTITVSGSLNNYGAIHSNDSLVITGNGIINRNTGGISSLTLLDVTSSTGNINNYGAFYAGQSLMLRATSGNLTNHATTGTIDSSSDMTLFAGNTFTNNNTINATRDIVITATTFRNEIPGGIPARQWTEIAWGPVVQTGYQSNAWIASEGDEWWYYQQDGSRHQYFTAAIPALKPQIIAGRNMAVSGFTAGYNIGGVIAASSGSLSITGSGSFTNDDLALITENITKTWHTWKDYGFFSDTWHYNRDLTEVVTPSTARSYGAGIFAQTLNAAGFSLYNQSSPWAPSPSSLSASSGTNFSTINLNLPSNPNGYFVVSRDPDASYLIETNPMFAVGSNFVGSNYLAERYGYNPDDIQRRLGDSNYEAYLIRQQLIEHTGSNLLKGYGDESAQMQRLMDQAVAQADGLGFEWGKPLSTDQIAGLTQDIVWMVETVIDGQRVLTPQVYLAPTTIASITGGAIIAGDDVDLDLADLENTGGTIEGSGSLTVSAQGDITNTSGTLRGGDVSLTSTEGSIRNETLTHGSGNDKHYKTTIGKSAGIEATGNLDMSAKQDIDVIGANVKAGGDATLSAGGDITFDTIIDKTTTTTHSQGSALQRLMGQNSSSTTTTTTEINIGSRLQTGGDLKLNSGGNTTIAGSEATVSGDLTATTGGKFSIEARQDKVTTHTEEKTSGIGVGGGLYGTQLKTTDSFKGTNVGSTLNVGGNADIKSDDTMKLQGSDMNVAGDANIEARKGIQVLDGLDEERTTTRTETTTFLSIGNSSGTNSASGSDSDSGNGVARSSATASTDAGSSDDFNLYQKTVTVTESGSDTSVASTLTVGGNLNMKSDETVTIQGSDVAAGGDLAIDAGNVEVLTGRNESWSETTTTRTSIGIFTDSGAGAEAEASAQASGRTAGSDASASAGTSAGATITAGVRHETEREENYNLTNRGSSLTAGGNMDIQAKQTATFQGADVTSGGDMNIEAENIRNLAAEDISENSRSYESHTAGVYLSGDASAGGGAEARENLRRTDAEVSGAAYADGSVGLRHAMEKSSSSEETITNVTNIFKSGGDFNRSAKDTITDQGTQVEAGGNINQSARVIRDEAVSDRTTSETDSYSHDARIGAYAKAGVAASTKDGDPATMNETGIRARYQGSINSEISEETTAVTSRFKAGGNIQSTSTDETVLTGTQFESGGDVDIEAGSLDYRAARDTTSSSSTSHDISAEAAINHKKEFGAEGAYDLGMENEQTSTARIGSVSAGGNFTVRTKEDARFEGTDIEAGGRADITAGGDVVFDAAVDKTSGDSLNIGVIGATGNTLGRNKNSVDIEYSNTGSSTAHTGGIRAGEGIGMSAGGDIDLEGTHLQSGGDIDLTAGNDVRLRSATSSEHGVNVGVSVEVRDGDNGVSDGTWDGGGKAEGSYKSTSAATSLNAEGNINIRGKTIVDQDASLESGGTTQMEGNLKRESTTDVDISIGIDLR